MHIFELKIAQLFVNACVLTTQHCIPCDIKVFCSVADPDP
jgi:hypothetical protein